MPKLFPLQSDLAAMRALYGNPDANNDGAADPAWAAKYLTTITPPYAMFYDGKPVKKITVNKGCAAQLLGALTDVGKLYGSAAAIKKVGLDQFGGVFNFRPKRGNAKSLSMHGYACAIDLDPAHNAFKSKKPGRMPAEVVKIFESWGATWLGPKLDPMHFQWSRVK